jgi:NIMA-interacting peptidyl-prolyl cis-trans isomerase 1
MTGATQWDLPVSVSEEGGGGQGQPVCASGNKCHAYHLLLKHAQSRRPASWRQDPITITEAEALEECRHLRAQIYADPRGIFEGLKAIAKVRSDCSSAKRDGDLGFFERGQMQSKMSAWSQEFSIFCLLFLSLLAYNYRIF